MAISDNLFWRRLHSFTGALPLGGYLLFHLYQNSYSLLGPAAYDAHVRPLRALPGLPFIETTFIFIPLLYHSLYGIYVWTTGQSNALQYGYLRNWLYTKQRITGLIVFAFIAFHLYDQRLRPDVSFGNVAGSLANPYVLAIYILGVAAAAWHMGNGLWNALVKWGVTIGPKAQRTSFVVFGALGIGLIIMGLRALAGFIK